MRYFIGFILIFAFTIGCSNADDANSDYAVGEWQQCFGYPGDDTYSQNTMNFDREIVIRNTKLFLDETCTEPETEHSNLAGANHYEIGTEIEMEDGTIAKKLDIYGTDGEVGIFDIVYVANDKLYLGDKNDEGFPFAEFKRPKSIDWWHPFVKISDE